MALIKILVRAVDGNFCEPNHSLIDRAFCFRIADVESTELDMKNMKGLKMNL